MIRPTIAAFAAATVVALAGCAAGKAEDRPMATTTDATTSTSTTTTNAPVTSTSRASGHVDFSYSPAIVDYVVDRHPDLTADDVITAVTVYCGDPDADVLTVMNETDLTRSQASSVVLASFGHCVFQ